MKVTLIRHTRVDVAPGTCYGQTDVPVAATFPEEAKATKERIKGKTFDKVFSSPLTRARILAEACGYTDYETDDRLKEINMGDWEMQRYDEIQDENLQKWYDNYMTFPPTNGESYEEMLNRVSSFLDELKKESYQNVAIFAHCGVLLCAGIYGGLFPKEGCHKHMVDYGNIEEIEI